MKALIWDLDGTIADTAELHFQAWRATMPRYGVDYTEAAFLASFGRNNVEILTELLDTPTPATIHKISDEKEHAFRLLVTPTTVQLLPGVAEWLQYFRTHQVRQAIGSSGPMANIAAVVTALEAGDFFHALLSGFGLPRGKPDPMLFRHCAAALGVAAGECVVIEDSIHGVEGAWRAGMACVAVGALAVSPQLEPYLMAHEGPRVLPMPALEQPGPRSVKPRNCAR